MRLLFDQAVPLPLRKSLTRHEVRTAAQQGWDRFQNGDLLDAAERAAFDVFVTTDKNMRYQQAVAGRAIAVVLLTRQQWPTLKRHVAITAAAVDEAVRGSYTEVSFPDD